MCPRIPTRLPDVFYQFTRRVALHPDGRSMVIGTHLGPIRWVRGKKLNIPANLDPKAPRPRLAYSLDGRFLAFAPPKGGLSFQEGPG